MKVKPQLPAKTAASRKFVDERLDHKIFVYLTEDQYSRIVALADKQAVSVSCLIRKKLKDDKLI